MKITVLGGSGAWPEAGGACSGYLVEHHGFRVLIDPGYATLPKLLEHMTASAVDAVLVSHGHPDHCADLNPLLRARTLVDEPAAALPVYALPGALDPVLGLDRAGMLDDAIELHDLDAGKRFGIGPYQIDTWSLPHFVPNVGLRLTAGGQVLAYTGDTGPSPSIADLARNADVFLAEATRPERIPADAARHLSTARQAGENAARAGVGNLVLTHLEPGTSAEESTAAARTSYPGEITVARPGVTVG